MHGYLEEGKHMYIASGHAAHVSTKQSHDAPSQGFDDAAAAATYQWVRENDMQTVTHLEGADIAWHDIKTAAADGLQAFKRQPAMVEKAHLLMMHYEMMEQSMRRDHELATRIEQREIEQSMRRDHAAYEASQPSSYNNSQPSYGLSSDMLPCQPHQDSSQASSQASSHGDDGAYEASQPSSHNNSQPSYASSQASNTQPSQDSHGDEPAAHVAAHVEDHVLDEEHSHDDDRPRDEDEEDGEDEDETIHEQEDEAADDEDDDDGHDDRTTYEDEEDEYDDDPDESDATPEKRGDIAGDSLGSEDSWSEEPDSPTEDPDYDPGTNWSSDNAVVRNTDSDSADGEYVL